MVLALQFDLLDFVETSFSLLQMYKKQSLCNPQFRVQGLGMKPLTPCSICHREVFKIGRTLNGQDMCIKKKSTKIIDNPYEIQHE